MKKDIFKQKERYLNWKEKFKETDLEGISKCNSEIIKRYIFDMENGINIANGSSKGSRSYVRLNNLRQRICFLAKGFEQREQVYSVQFMEKKLTEIGKLTEILFKQIEISKLKKK